MTTQVSWCSEELLEMHEEPYVVPGKLSDNSQSYQVASLSLVLWHTLGGGEWKAVSVRYRLVGEAEQPPPSCTLPPGAISSGGGHRCSEHRGVGRTPESTRRSFTEE